jgi:hypothetical protein
MFSLGISDVRVPAIALLAASTSLWAPLAAGATTLMADTVIDFSNSGAFALFADENVAYGGTFPGRAFVDYPKKVPFTHATDGDPGTFLSLSRGSHIVLGFSGGHVFDGDGADIRISEAGDNDEEADVYVSSDEGKTFTSLGSVKTGPSGIEIDLGLFGFTGLVNAIKIVGKDAFGVAPGFDLAFVSGLNFRSHDAPPPPPPPPTDVSTIPLPASLPMLGAGLLALGLLRRRRSRD